MVDKQKTINVLEQFQAALEQDGWKVGSATTAWAEALRTDDSESLFFAFQRLAESHPTFEQVTDPQRLREIFARAIKLASQQ